jgi:hypothetical protein
MPEANLLMVCLQAFAAVMILLTALAGAMRLLVQVFPDRTPRADTSLVAAISQAVHAAWPGRTVTAVEEIR